MNKDHIEYRKRFADINYRQIYVSGFAAKMFGTKQTGEKIKEFVPLDNKYTSFGNENVLDIYCTGRYAYLVTNHNIYCVIIHNHNNGQTHKLLLPEEITLTESLYVTKIICGKEHTVILLNDGRIMSYGLGYYGELGLGADMRREFNPKLINVGNFDGPIVDIVCGDLFTSVLTDRNSVYIVGKILIDNSHMRNDTIVYNWQKICVDSNETIILVDKYAKYNYEKLCVHKIAATTDQLIFFTYDKTIYITNSKMKPFSNQPLFLKINETHNVADLIRIYLKLCNKNIASIISDSRYHKYLTDKYPSDKPIKHVWSGDNSVAINVDDDIYLWEPYADHGCHHIMLSTILQKYSEYYINVQNKYDWCSIVINGKYKRLTDQNYFVSNLYESIFGSNHTLSDILFINKS